MSTFDISLAIILAGFVFNGLFKGLIRLLGHLVSLILGAYLASHFYLIVFEWGKDLANGYEAIGKVIAFIIIFVVVTRVTNYAFYLVEKVFNIIAFIPFTKYINNLLGAVLGLLEGSLFLGLIVYVIARYTIIGNFFGDQLASSQIAPFLLKFVNFILPILPDALKALKAII